LTVARPEIIPADNDLMDVLPNDYSPMHGLFTEDSQPYRSSGLPLAHAAIIDDPGR
jgi:hypothetical protein